MSAFIKGQKVRAIRDTKSLGAETPIEKGAVLEVSRTAEAESGVLFNAVRPGGGEYALVRADFEPEPKSERKPGTLAIVTPSMFGGIVNRALRGTDGGWYTEAGGHWDDDEVLDVHELAVIDPAKVDVDALVEVAHHDRVLYGDTTPDQMRRAILRVLAHMGIEVAR